MGQEMTDLDRFRRQNCATGLQENCPEEMRDGRRPKRQYLLGWKELGISSRTPRSTWLNRCAERGFTVPTWPEAYGGAGLDPGAGKDLA